jgi:hypothetical protein
MGNSKIESPTLMLSKAARTVVEALGCGEKAYPKWTLLACVGACITMLQGNVGLSRANAGPFRGNPPPPPAPRTGTPQPATRGSGLVTVTDRFPQMTKDDALNLAKIKTVIDQATPDMIYSATGCEYGEFHYFPPDSGTHNAENDLEYISQAFGSPEHPYAAVWAVHNNPAAWEENDNQLFLFHREPSPLAPNTPILIWHGDTSSEEMIAVTFDGGRYYIRGKNCPHGVRGALPPPVQHYVLTGNQIKFIEGLGQLPKGTSQKIEDTRAAGNACALQVWKSRFDAKAKANRVANITESTRENRDRVIGSDYKDAYTKVCAPQQKKLSALFEAALSDYKKQRMSLYQSVEAKLKTLVGGK